MLKLGGVDVAKVVGKTLQANVKGDLSAITLVKVAETPPVSSTDGPSVVRTNYSTVGIVSTYENGVIDGTLIRSNDREVLLIGTSIASAQVPTQSDELIFEGRTWQIVKVDSDPARATYTVQAR